MLTTRLFYELKKIRRKSLLGKKILLYTSHRKNIEKSKIYSCPNFTETEETNNP